MDYEKLDNYWVEGYNAGEVGRILIQRLTASSSRGIIENMRGAHIIDTG